MNLRNLLFERGILRQESFPVPVVSVGNLSVDGTGKTPHTERIASYLSDLLTTAILSRGYGRQTHGYRIVSPDSTAEEVGDEPLQMACKQVAQIVAVCENRRKGIRQLLDSHLSPQAIVLDDGFQHRYVERNLDIVLTDYHRLYALDLPLPAGRLREHKSHARRAQVIVVTKCPTDLTENEAQSIRNLLQPTDTQRLLFSAMDYGTPYPMDAADAIPLTPDTHVVLLTGIAHAETLEAHCRNAYKTVYSIAYSDHHRYTEADLHQVETALAALPTGKRAIVTTEKDAARLKGHKALSHELRQHIYIQPIRTEFLFDGWAQMQDLLKKTISAFA